MHKLGRFEQFGFRSGGHLADKVHKFAAILLLLELADTVDLTKGFEGGGALLYEQMEHLVGEDDVGWQAILVGQPLAQRPQGVVEFLGSGQGRGGEE